MGRKRKLHDRITDEKTLIKALSKHPFILKTRGYSRRTVDIIDAVQDDVDGCWWWVEASHHCELHIGTSKNVIQLRGAELRIEQPIRKAVLKMFHKHLISLNLLDCHTWLKLRIDREWYFLCLKRNCSCQYARRFSEVLKEEMKPVLREYTPICDNVINTVLTFV